MSLFQCPLRPTWLTPSLAFSGSLLLPWPPQHLSADGPHSSISSLSLAAVCCPLLRTCSVREPYLKTGQCGSEVGPERQPFTSRSSPELFSECVARGDRLNPVTLLSAHCIHPIECLPGFKAGDWGDGSVSKAHATQA